MVFYKKENVISYCYVSVFTSSVPVDDYVYDYYTVKNDVEIAEDDASHPFPLCVFLPFPLSAMVYTSCFF